ncbi:TonB-dependent receptor [Segetibacter sp. 3557_3]|uniref:SusC/RagA family TonB-linked outer membrane protein n=1 Tax=Segetibacter sp. 3557_3 TaxID=2547429 RepID=UPI0010587C4A|nr:TonB-dependent receptor [Segetibacter sp. 3557_3]TDH24575.1 TonB-dependent receptor [Segetibacter sp. 3557_3]
MFEEKRQYLSKRLTNALLLLCSLFMVNALFAQGGSLVTGKVITDKEELPLKGVTVSVKGGNQMTLSDVNGNFRISAASSATLLFTSVGFVDQEVPVSDQSNLTIRLVTTARTLNEVVVTVPYGRQTRASYTGSLTTVAPEVVANRSRASFQESLQGNVPGLIVSQGSGQPGAALNINIRGLGSFSASNSPLFVVDGIPVVDVPATAYAWSSNTLAGINPNDIESITVLKDASATSIYGSRGGNGVILITTKRGAAGSTKIEATVQHGYNEMTRKDRNKPLNTAEMTELLTEGVLNNPSLNISTPEAARTYLVAQGLNPNVSTDWQDLIIRRGKFSQYGLSASGGNEKTTFFVSAGYFKQDAVVKGVDYERMNTRINFTHKANRRLNINGGLGLNYQDMNTVRAAWWGENPIRNLRLTSPFYSPYNADGSYNLGIAYNNEVLINENKKNSMVYQTLGNLGAEFKILDQLSIESRGSIDFNFGDEELYWDPQWVDAQALNGVGGNYSTKVSNWNITNLLKYRQQFGDFGAEAILGQEAQRTHRKLLVAEKANFAAQGLETLDAASQLLAVGSAVLERSLVSYFLNTSFNYKNRYFVNLTGRRDGASPFGADRRFGNFGSIGFAWNMEKEAFMESVGFVNSLKLRASYGVTGNQPSNWYAAQGFYSAGFNYGNVPGYAVSGLANASLTWEKNKPFDIGVDFSILKNRLSGTVDYYQRRTSNLLFSVPVSYTNGGPASVFNNIGAFDNKGVEVSLTAQNIRSTTSNGFNWTTSFNISTQKNKIVSLTQQQNRIVDGFFVHEQGGSMYEFYMRGWAGVDAQTGEGMWYLDEGRKTTTKVYNDAAFAKQGSALPKVFGGLTNSFSYKGVSLSFLIFYNFGNKLYDNYGHFTSSDAAQGTNVYGSIDRTTYENRWRKPGDIAFAPKMVFRGTQTGVAQQHSSRWLYDGDYIRLRDITISYDLPIKRFVTNAQIYLRGNNLITYVKDDRLPYDPEGYLGGLNNGQVPVSKQIVAGLNLSF